MTLEKIIKDAKNSPPILTRRGETTREFYANAGEAMRNAKAQMKALRQQEVAKNQTEEMQDKQDESVESVAGFK